MSKKDCQTNIEPITVIMMNKKLHQEFYSNYSSSELFFIAKMTFLALQISFYFFFFAPASNLLFHFHGSSYLKKILSYN